MGWGGRARSADDEQRKASERDFHDHAWEHDVRGCFDRFYDVARSSHERYERLVLGRAPGCDVLELGCGDRPLAYRAAQAGARVTAIDLSPVAVAASAEKAAALGVEAEFVVMDAERLEFADESFDIVCASGVLHHLAIAAALAEITRVLRPGGCGVFLEPLGHNPAINAVRALTPRFRTPDEHPLRIADVELLASGFAHAEPTYHHLLGLAAFPFRRTRAFEPVLDRLDRLDARLVRRSGLLRRWSWLVVLDLRDPLPQR